MAFKPAAKAASWVPSASFTLAEKNQGALLPSPNESVFTALCLQNISRCPERTTVLTSQLRSLLVCGL